MENKLLVSYTNYLPNTKELGKVNEDAVKLMKEAFPNHPIKTLDYYKWVVVTTKKSNGEVLGVITANPFLPTQAIILDVAVKEEYRSKGIILELMNKLGDKLLLDGIVTVLGITEENNRAALKTYKRFSAEQTHKILSECNIRKGKALLNQLKDSIKYRKEYNKKYK